VLPANPRRILDIGYGTGFWMLDMETKYPGAEIIGLDMEEPPTGVKSNGRLNFRSGVDFTTPRWPVEDSSVDLVHMAQLLGCVPNWMDQYSKAYK
jgi:ubiquinone/menaquinone biosynthesis C-methylase UbiE